MRTVVVAGVVVCSRSDQQGTHRVQVSKLGQNNAMPFEILYIPTPGQPLSVCTTGFCMYSRLCNNMCCQRFSHTLVTLQRNRPYATAYFATGSVHRPLCSTCFREPQASCCRDLPQVHRRPGPCNCGMFSCAQDHCCQHRCC